MVYMQSQAAHETARETEVLDPVDGFDHLHSRDSAEQLGDSPVSDNDAKPRPFLKNSIIQCAASNRSSLVSNYIASIVHLL